MDLDDSKVTNDALNAEDVEGPGHELSERLGKPVHWKSIGLWLIVGLSVLIVIVWFGRHSAHEIKEMETWVAGRLHRCAQMKAKGKRTMKTL